MLGNKNKPPVVRCGLILCVEFYNIPRQVNIWTSLRYFQISPISPNSPHLLVFMSSPLSSGDITELYEFSQNHPHIESPLWNLTARDNRSFTEVENIYFWSREKCPRHCLLSEDIDIKYYINNVVQYYDIPANKLLQWNIRVFMTEISGQLD